MDKFRPMHVPLSFEEALFRHPEEAIKLREAFIQRSSYFEDNPDSIEWRYMAWQKYEGAEPLRERICVSLSAYSTASGEVIHYRSNLFIPTRRTEPENIPDIVLMFVDS